MTREQRAKKEIIDKLEAERDHYLKRIGEHRDQILKLENKTNTLISDDDRVQFIEAHKRMVDHYLRKINRVNKAIECVYYI